MAERISACDATFRFRGAPSIYPWDQWADGSMWHLRRDTDYKISTKAFRDVCYVHARRNGLKVHTRETDHGLVVTFRNPAAGRVRHFLPDTDLARVVTLTQAEIDEDPNRIGGLTELQLVPTAQEAA
jgi:hypothetical protein